MVWVKEWERERAEARRGAGGDDEPLARLLVEGGRGEVEAQLRAWRGKRSDAEVQEAKAHSRQVRERVEALCELMARRPEIAASRAEADAAAKTLRERWSEMSVVKKRLRESERWAESEREGWRASHPVRAWLHDRGVFRARSLERIEGAVEYARAQARRATEEWHVVRGIAQRASERYASLLEAARPEVEREYAATELHREQGRAGCAAGDGRGAAPTCRELAAEEGGGARRAGTVELAERER